MLRFISKRLLHLIPLFFGITLISFWVIHMAPGKPSVLGEELNPRMTLEVRQRLEKLYGLDEPIGTRYIRWLRKLVCFDFGNSFSDGRPVSDKFFETIPVTLVVNCSALILILGFGIPLGVSSALHRDAWWERISSALLFAAFAAPTFWLALVFMDVFGVKLGWLPVSGLTSLDHEYLSGPQKIADVSRHLVLPVFISGVGGLVGVTRYMQQSMNEVLEQRYILAARSRGLPERRVLYHHGVPNALLPIITVLGLSVPGLIGGSVIFESIFAIPGTGRLFFNAVMARDYPVIMAMLVLSAVLTLLGNLLADVGYALADPRVRTTTLSHDS